MYSIDLYWKTSQLYLSVVDFHLNPIMIRKQLWIIWSSPLFCLLETSAYSWLTLWAIPEEHTRRSVHSMVWERNPREVSQIKKSDGVLWFYPPFLVYLSLPSRRESSQSPDHNYSWSPFILFILYVYACTHLINIQFLCVLFLYTLHNLSHPEVCFFWH